MSNPIYEIFPEHFFPLGFTIWGHAMGFHCRDGMISGLAIAGYSWLQFCGFLSVTITYYYIILHLITESYIPPKYEISNESPEECTSNWGYVFRTGVGLSCQCPVARPNHRCTSLNQTASLPREIDVCLFLFFLGSDISLKWRNVLFGKETCTLW